MQKSIIIPVYNQSHFTKQCLSDLFSLDSDNEIIIVNNGSTDSTIPIIERIVEKVHTCGFKLINNDKNLGFAKACNIGYSNSTGSIVIFLNNDIRISKGSLISWTNDIEKQLTDNLLVSPTGGMLDINFNFQYETNGMKRWNYLSGWLLCGYKATFNKLAENLNQQGPFIEEFTTYFEDTYLSFQARKLNIDMHLIKVPIQHIGKGTSNRMNLQDIYLSAKQKFIKKVKQL